MRICFGLVLMRGNLELWHVYRVEIRGDRYGVGIRGIDMGERYCKIKRKGLEEDF